MFLHLYSDTHPHYVTINPWLDMLQSIKFLNNQLWWHNQVSWNSFNAPSILIYIPLVCHCICSNYIYFLYIYKYIYIYTSIYICITIIKLLYTVSIAPVFFLKPHWSLMRWSHRWSIFFMKSRFWWNKSRWSSRFHGQQWSNGSSQIKAGPPEALPLVVPLGFHCPGGWDDFRGLCHGACPMGTCIKYAW